MTSSQLIPDAPPSAEVALVAWLTPLGRTGTQRAANEALPFRIVKRVAGADDPVIGIDTASVSVHTLAATVQAAHDEARLTHRRMAVLARSPQTEITLFDQSTVCVDYCRTTMSPVEIDYGEPGIVRYVARYDVGVSYTAL